MSARAEWRGVLAYFYGARLRGSWRPASVPEPTTLAHLVALEDFKAGRITRKRGQTLCNRIPADHMCDAPEADNPAKCARCEQVATTYKVEVL